MPTVMLVFLVSVLGNAMTFVLGYPTLDACEKDMARMLDIIKSDKALAKYFAVCGVPIPAKDDV